MNQYKTCSKCGQSKPLGKFSKHNGKKSSKSGYRSSCKDCDVEYNRLYRQRNRDKVNAAKRKWAADNKDSKAEQDKKYRLLNQEKIAKRNKQWRIKNSDYTKEKALAWRTANKQRKAITDRAWAQNNKENVRNISLRRRARLFQNGIYRVTKQDIIRLLNAGCMYCGNPAQHVDHVIPVSRGGTHSIGNLTGACASCNLSKGSKFVMEWKRGRK